MTTKNERYKQYEEDAKKNALHNLKLRPNERLTCCKCKNQTFLLVFGVADFPFFDLFCSKCGSGYPLKVGK
jgi:hypothetical protein